LKTLNKKFTFVIKLLLAFSVILSAHAEETWRGLVVKPENRCSPYDKKKQYPYPQSVEDIVVEQMGGVIYGPYSGNYFSSDSETDIEHILATAEAHDSGLCGASADKRKQIAIDPLNLTLAAPEVNRCQAGGKCAFDAGEWMPKKNKCWFANRIVEIKTKYGLSVDQAEANALEEVLSSCDSFEMIFFPRKEDNPGSNQSQSIDNALMLYDDNNNGRITCSEARNHGIAPVTSSHQAYPFMNDGDGDGVVCE